MTEYARVARRFRFPLETLLKVRRLREREARRKVAAQRAGIARLDLLDQAARREIATRQGALLGNQQQQRLDPRELTRARAWIAHLHYTVTQRQIQRAEMVEKLEGLLDRFRAARKQMRVIEKLRERRWNEYKRDRQRSEQAADDELAQQLHTLAQTSVASPRSERRRTSVSNPT